jgi:hypothetical protein
VLSKRKKTMSIADQISNLSDEDQQRFHAYAQKRLRKIRAQAKNKTEKEIDNEKRANPK